MTCTLASQPPQSSLLVPVDYYKQCCLKDLTESEVSRIHVKEWQLIGQPESLKALTDVFVKDADDPDHRLVWITDKTFVCQSGSISTFPGIRQDRWFEMVLQDASKTTHYDIRSATGTIEEAMQALDFLLELQDTHFPDLTLTYRVSGEFGRTIYPCPLSCPLVTAVIAQNPNRRISFFRFAFTPEQSRALASSGTRSWLVFSDCTFEDEGTAFLDEFAAHQECEAGPAKLSIWTSAVFDEKNWLLLLAQPKLEVLVICDIVFDSVALCRALAKAELKYLSLYGSKLSGDGGAALVQSVQEGRGPKGLSFRSDLFDTAERFVSFLNAIAGNTTLKQLNLRGTYTTRPGIPPELACALRENQGLSSFGIDGHTIDQESWSDLMNALSTHPSLQRLTFENMGVDQEQKAVATRTLADILLLNQQVDDISVDQSSFDPIVWNTVAIPRMECNVYRKKLCVTSSTRAAAMAKVFAHVSSRPTLTWMFLSEQYDVVSVALQHALAQSSLKRQSSPLQ